MYKCESYATDAVPEAKARTYCLCILVLQAVMCILFTWKFDHDFDHQYLNTTAIDIQFSFSTSHFLL